MKETLTKFLLRIGVFHCYAGSVEMAKEILDWGMYIAFGGSLTFKKSVRPVEVAKYVPLDRIVIETDSPYLTPEPHRGKRNSSLYIHYVAEKLAAVKGISVEEIESATYENAKKCFGIKYRLQKVICLLYYSAVSGAGSSSIASYAARTLLSSIFLISLFIG